MGSGIAQVSAQIAKRNVLLMDANPKALEKSLAAMDSLLQKQVAKGKVTDEERVATMSRIKPVSSLSELKDADFVVEAATENTDLKLNIFKSLDEVVAPDVILATNTSSISITKIGSATKRPDKVIGMHFVCFSLSPDSS